eukprot:916617-Prymnesium_polylepis.2
MLQPPQPRASKGSPGELVYTPARLATGLSVHAAKFSARERGEAAQTAALASSAHAWSGSSAEHSEHGASALYPACAALPEPSSTPLLVIGVVGSDAATPAVVANRL